MRATLPALLSLNAGYVDAAGFLALQGLFTAHVTGNFVTLGASLVLGTSGALAKLLALPVFCVVVIATRLLDTALCKRHWPAFEVLVALEVVFLVVGSVLAVRFGPFPDVGSPQAFLSGMTLVAAMAIQNAFHRIHLASVPPSTVMTGTTTQVMIDLADRIYAPSRIDSHAGARLIRMSVNMLFFAIGCGGAAFLYSRVGVKCFLVPPAVGVLQFIALRRIAPATQS